MRARFKLKVFEVIMALISLFIFLPLFFYGTKALSTEIRPVPYNKKEVMKKMASEIKPVAKSYGLKPSLIIGQALLESQYGRTLLASKYHNLYSLPTKSNQNYIDLKTPIYRSGSWANEDMRFSVYHNWTESTIDYLNALRTGRYLDKALYKQLVLAKDDSEAAQLLQYYSFNTDPNYANKLKLMINDNRLTKYDK